MNQANSTLAADMAQPLVPRRQALRPRVVRQVAQPVQVVRLLVVRLLVVRARPVVQAGFVR